MVFKNLLRRKLRTAFSVFGVGVGISLMVAMFTLSDDLMGQISALLTSQRGDVVALRAGRNALNSEVDLGGRDGRPGLLERLKAEPNVISASPLVWSYMNTEQRIGPASQLDYYGVTENSPAIRKFTAVDHVAPGEPLIRDDDPNGFIVGKRLFDLVNGILPPEKRLKVGQELDLGKLLLEELSDFFVSKNDKPWREMTASEREEVTIRRLRNSGVDPVAAATMKGLYLRAVFTAPQPLMEAAIFFPLPRAQALRGMPNGATVIMMELGDNSPAAMDALIARLDTRYDGIRFERSDEVENIYAEYVALFQNMIWAISMIAAVAGALGVLNIMVLSVHERTSEIGLLLAVGWSRWRVMRMILLEGTVITLLGGIAGLGLGYVEMVVVQEWFDLIFLTPRIDPYLSGLSMGVAGILGVIASLYPAWRASRLTPMDALRRE